MSAVESFQVTYSLGFRTFILRLQTMLTIPSLVVGWEQCFSLEYQVLRFNKGFAVEVSSGDH